jgi:transcriptional regulator with XRE-family HTH domain
MPVLRRASEVTARATTPYAGPVERETQRRIIPPMRFTVTRPPAAAPRRLRLWRLSKNLSQAQLATLAGISKSSVARIEKSEDGTVNLRHLVNLALALDCELLDIIEDDWLSYLWMDVSAAPPARQALGRSAGGTLPACQRERAPASRDGDRLGDAHRP